MTYCDQQIQSWSLFKNWVKKAKEIQIQRTIKLSPQVRVLKMEGVVNLKMFRFSKTLKSLGRTEGRIGEVMLHARYRNSGHCPWKSMIGINRRVKRLRERTFKQ